MTSPIVVDVFLSSGVFVATSSAAKFVAPDDELRLIDVFRD
jgi:hypothetical protein